MYDPESSLDFDIKKLFRARTLPECPAEQRGTTNAIQTAGLKNTVPETSRRDCPGSSDRAFKGRCHLAVEAILKTAYWKMKASASGNRVIGRQYPRALHGAHLRSTSDDMTKTNRQKGFSVRNLATCAAGFMPLFPIRQLTAELTWILYVVLSVIKDKEERKGSLPL